MDPASIFESPTFRRFLLLGFLLLATGLETPLLGQGAGVSEGNYSFVILPDTQYYYTDQGSGNFGKWLSQMNWIRDHVESHNIKYVLHLGDITDQADHSSTHLNQWNSARLVAGGIMDKVPLALSVGNHDGLGNSRTSLFSNPEYFGTGSAYASQPTLIETMDSDLWENSVHRLEVQGQSWLILTLEWGPRDSVVAWADDVLTRYPDDNVILILHAYMYRDSSRFDWGLLGEENRDERQSGNPLGYGALTGDPEGANDGQKLWNKLIRRHNNVKLVLNGHVGRSGHGRRVAIGDDRHFVHQHLVNFQFWSGDGNGRMRLLEVDPTGDAIKVTSFSPVSGIVLDGPDLDFTFSLSSKQLKTHYREALRELDPVAAFRLQGEDTSRPLISQFPTWEIAQTEGFGIDNGSWFESGRRIAYQSSTTADEAWTALLWFRSDQVQEILPILQIGTEFNEVLSVSADTSVFSNLPLDASHSRSDFDAESKGLTVKMEPSQWHHLVLQVDEGKLMAMLDGEVLSKVDFPVADIDRFTLGDFADEPTGPDGEWRIQDFSYHAEALSIADIEWLWRSAFCQMVSGEITLTSGLEPIPEMQVVDDTYPGFALRPEVGGEVLFGGAESSIYRVQDVLGASRDPYRRHLRLPKTLEYSDGILLATPQVSDASGAAGAPSPVQWKLLNRIEGLYSGSAYATVGMSVLNVPLPYPFDASIAKLNSTFFPFASDWKGGYIDRTGGYLYGQKEVIEQVPVSRPGGATYRFTPPEGWNGFTLLGQTSLENTRMTVQPFENAWDVTIHEGGQPSPTGEIPFSFILLPQEAEGVRSGWFDPEDSTGDGTLWQVVDTGSYRLTAPMGGGTDGVLQITPGTLDGGVAPLMRLYSSAGGVWALEFEFNGEKVDAPFAWAWISSAKAPPEKTMPVDTRVLVALEDSAYGDFGWYFTERLSWIYAGYENWPWVWSPSHGWLYLFPTTPPSNGLWFYSRDDGTYLYVDREFPFWAYSMLDGWIPWNREDG